MLKIGSKMTRRGERGNIVLALLVSTVLLGIGATVTTRTIANLGQTRRAQDFSGALAGADAGVADAEFHIDQFGSGGAAPSSFCVGPVSGCVASGVPGAPGVEYKATQVTADEWTVVSEGLIDKVPHAVRLTIDRSALYPFALFGNQQLAFNGQAGDNAFGTYDSANSASGVNPNGPVAVGSNGTVSCNGGLPANVTTVYYTGGGGISGSCGTPQASSTLHTLPAVTAPAGALPCPNGGSLGSGISPSYSTISPGTYLCAVPVTVTGQLSILPAGTVKIYIVLPSGSNTSSTSDLTITAGSAINIPSSPYLPVAADFQVFSNGIGTVGDSNGLGFTFGGLLYAPNGNLTGNGCKSTFYGSLVINTFTCNGGPHLSIYYDSDLSSLVTPWAASGYTEIPSSLVQLP